MLNGHPAPLDRLPVFVRAGAVIPQGVVARNASLVPEDAPITVVAYPQGESAFELYEDDEVTRAYADGESSSAAVHGRRRPKAGKTGTVKIELGERDGTYDGKADARPYRVEAHTGLRAQGRQARQQRPSRGSPTPQHSTTARAGRTRPTDAGGVVLIATGAIASDETGSPHAHRHERRGRPGGGCRRGIRRRRTRRSGVPGGADHRDGDVPQHRHEGEGRRRAHARGARGLDARVGVGRPGRHREAGRLRHGRVHLRGDGCRSRRPADRDGRPRPTRRRSRPRTVSGANQLYVAYGSLAGAYNAVSDHRPRDREGRELRRRRCLVLGGGARSRAGVTPGWHRHGRHRATRPSRTPGPSRWARRTRCRPRGRRSRVGGQGTHLAILASAASGGGVNPELDAHLHRRHGVEAAGVLPELAAAGVGPRRGDRRGEVARAQQRDEPERVRVPDVRLPGVLEPRAPEPRRRSSPRWCCRTRAG